MPLAVRLASESASSESTGVSCGLPLFGGEDVDEVLGRCLEKSDELLEVRVRRASLSARAEGPRFRRP